MVLGRTSSSALSFEFVGTNRKVKPDFWGMLIMAKEIWFGVHAPPEGRNFEETKEICQTAEEEGFDLFTMTDHFMNMRNPTGPGNHPLENWTTLAGLAAVTHTIKLGPL